MLEHLIRRLRELGVDVDTTSIAESLWLAAIMQQQQPEAGPVEAPGPGEPLVPLDPPRQQERVEPAHGTTNEIGVHSHEPDDVGTRRAARTYVPAGRALPQALELGRALRPFKTPFRNGARYELAVDATIDRYVETRSLTPVFEPVPERWFNVDVVIDRSSSMRVWQETVREAVELLRQTGAFRLVREWHLDVDDQESLLRDINGMPIRPERLRDPHQRRLIVIISDCVASGWYAGRTWTMVRSWLASTHTVLFNPLPPKLWRQTALDLPATRLHATTPGAPSATLKHDVPAMASLWFAGRWLPLPVAGLSPFSLRQWADTAMAGHRGGCDGVLVPDDDGLTRTDEDDDLPASTADQVHAFRMTASPQAWRLAVLSSTQDRLPLGVLRAIAQEMVPESQVSDLAELVVSGLFAEAAESSPSDLVLAFLPGVAEVLRDHLSTMDTWSVHDAMSAVLRRSGVDRGRVAAAAETDTGDLMVPDHLVPFAHAEAATLRLLEPRSVPVREPRRTTSPDVEQPPPQPRFVGIAVDEYQSLEPLSAGRSVSEMVDFLMFGGFRCATHTGPAEVVMRRSLSMIASAPQQGGALVVVWSGHAAVTSNEVRLLAVDNDHDSGGVALSDLWAWCLRSGADQVLLILDARGADFDLDDHLWDSSGDDGPSWWGALKSGGDLDDVFLDQVTGLLRAGPAAGWPGHGELIDGPTFLSAFAQDFEATGRRSGYCCDGVPSGLFPRAVPDLDQGESGVGFSVLGPVQLLSDGIPVPLQTVHSLTLLALLVANANELVTFETIDRTLALEPMTGRHVLTRLRARLVAAGGDGSAMIRESKSGCTLVVDLARVDVHRAERLITAARSREPEVRAQMLRDALHLWRGPALPELPGHPLAAHAERLRLDALAARIEADLALEPTPDRVIELVNELRVLRQLHPRRAQFARLIVRVMETLRWDVAITCAPEDGSYAAEIAQQLRSRGVLVFYYEDGFRDLPAMYRAARYLLPIMSAHYRVDLRALVDGEASEHQRILPMVLDDAGRSSRPEITFLDARVHSSAEIADLVVKRLRPELVDELRALSRGLGLREPDLELRVGPALRAVCGVSDHDDTAIVHRLLTRRLSLACEQLNSAQQIVATAALGLSTETAMLTAGERLEWLARTAAHSQSIAQRRVDLALERLAELLRESPALTFDEVIRQGRVRLRKKGLNVSILHVADNDDHAFEVLAERMKVLRTILERLTVEPGQPATVALAHRLVDGYTDLSEWIEVIRYARTSERARPLYQHVHSLTVEPSAQLSAYLDGVGERPQAEYAPALRLTASSEDWRLLETELALLRERAEHGQQLEIDVLGRVRIVVDGSEVWDLPPQGRRLLALLVANVGRSVRIDDIVGWLWPAEPPKTAQAIVRRTVSRLDEVFSDADARGSAMISATSDGVVFIVDPVCLDLDRARQLIKSAGGKPAKIRVALLREALGLWRGPAFEDMPDLPFKAEVDELRLSATEERIEAELELDRHLELLVELANLRARFPLRERLVRLNLLALQRAGLRADAVEMAREFRRTAEDNGIVPSGQFERLFEQIVQSEVKQIGSSATRVLLVDTHPVFRHGLRALLDSEKGFSVVGEASTGGDAMSLVLDTHPDVVVLSGGGALELVKQIHVSGTGCKVLVLTVNEDFDEVFALMRAGASGHLSKTAAPSDIVNAIGELSVDGVVFASDVARRMLKFSVSSQLTDGEHEVLKLLAAGKDHAEVADRLGIRGKTVRVWKSAALTKLRAFDEARKSSRRDS
ncbi:SAV_2336 N-terminal domain-related protein [Streptomyces sp. ID05-26A]|nr:SAV_2336 N-terminal domain-related protein [Streptomyces sp. ID05-26A]